MQWRLIELQTNNAFVNMAADEAISEAISAERAKPTVRFYLWQPSAVSIGYFQSLTREVNIEKCRELGFDCVRRRTGGGAVYHDYHGEITYSVIAPEALFPRSIPDSYTIVCAWIVEGLARLGIKAEFKPINDVIVGGKKISGNAQTRRSGILQQHGTILYDVDVRKMFSVLRVSDVKISDKLIRSVEERVTRILDHANVSKNEAYQALVEGFMSGKDYVVEPLSDGEIARAKDLALTKYMTDEWNFRR
jgi:lipoate-protein ligase A